MLTALVVFLRIHRPNYTAIGYTFGMKTAVSIPDEVFQRVEASPGVPGDHGARCSARQSRSTWRATRRTK